MSCHKLFVYWVEMLNCGQPCSWSLPDINSFFILQCTLLRAFGIFPIHSSADFYFFYFNSIIFVGALLAVLWSGVLIYSPVVFAIIS